MNMSRLSALRGAFYQKHTTAVTEEILPLSWAPPKRTILIFVSSTFTDTHEERNILLEKVLPLLRDHTRPHGLDILLLDLRSGITDENTVDHLTWLGCQTELRRCFHGSAGLFFLSLQGDKYGYMPIPKCIEQNAFEQRLTDSTSDALTTMAKEWYLLDSNALPPVYVLKNLTGDCDQDQVYWSTVLPALRELLMDVVFDPLFPDGIIGRSVTEYEVKAAVMLCAGDDDKVKNGLRWIHRHFEHGVSKTQDPKQELFDAHESSTGEKLEHLKGWMDSHVSAGQKDLVKTFMVSVDSFTAKDSQHQAYLDAFET